VNEVTTESYREGALIISIVDVSQKRIVWQARGHRVIGEKTLPKTREKRIDKAVAVIFRSYPFRYK
jgi:hypothetical protein